jgi:hypothetical protein
MLPDDVDLEGWWLDRWLMNGRLRDHCWGIERREAANKAEWLRRGVSADDVWDEAWNEGLAAGQKAL